MADEGTTLMQEFRKLAARCDAVTEKYGRNAAELGVLRDLVFGLTPRAAPCVRALVDYENAIHFEGDTRAAAVAVLKTCKDALGP